MADNVLGNFNMYIEDSTLQEFILDEHPASENVAQVYRKKLGEFYKGYNIRTKCRKD